MKLAGSVAMVTGAARRIGRAAALALAQQGAHIVVHYGSSAAAAEATVRQLAALGVEVVALQADLARPEEIRQLFGQVAERFGQLDILVNSAAVFRRQEFGCIEAADWDAVMAVNLRAPFLCTQQAARLMQAGHRSWPGVVINIADLSGVHAWRHYAHHGVSKAGLLHLTRIAARELAPQVRVNAIVPGLILPPPGVDQESAAWGRMGQSVPLERTGAPGDVGQAVVYLAASDYVTGVVLHVDGGEHLVGPGSR